MSGTVGVRFTKAGKIQYFDPGEDEDIDIDEYAVAETDRGLEVGWVVIAPKQVVMSKTKGPLPMLTRRATPDDLRTRDALKAKGAEVLQQCKELIAEFSLDMKPVEATFALDEARLTVTYTADERVDFRQLLRTLGRDMQAKIELRQIGPRDQAKVVDGMGRCGRTLCCSTWLTEFQPVTMKMAKEQALPLSPPGLAGQCGRLRCCLRYEYEQYRELKRGLPKIGTKVETSHGEAVVVVGHPLKQTVTVRLETGSWVEVPMDELTSHRN